MTELKKQARAGALWSGVDALGARLIQFIVGVILARLLAPSEFGLVAMLSVFIAVAQAIADGGFAVALIQKKELSQIETSSVLWANLGVSILLTALCFAGAPFAAEFYDEPKLTGIARALSFILVIDALSRIQASLLTRDLNFRTQAKVTLTAGLLSGITGIASAFAGLGVWSLVVQQLTTSTARTILYWSLSSWRPGTGFSLTALRPLFGFGSKMLASNILNQVFLNIYELVIGKMFDATTLGYYSRAARLQALPTSTLSAIYSRVTLPLFSQIQGENDRLEAAIRKVLQLNLLVSAPLMFSLAASADNLVPVLFTEKWNPCIPYFQLLCVFGLLQPIHSINLSALAASGRSDIFLTLEVIKKTSILVALALTFRHGVIAIILGRLVLEVLGAYLNTYYVAKEVGYGVFRQIADISPHLVVASLTGGIVFATGRISPASPALELALQIAAGAAFYLAVAFATKLKGLEDVLDTLRPIYTRMISRFA